MRRRTLFARTILAAILWPLMDTVMHACPICFQVENGHVAGGVRAAVVVLIGVTSTVVAGFAAFGVRLARHEAEPPPSLRLRRTNENPNAGTPNPALGTSAFATASADKLEPRNL